MQYGLTSYSKYNTHTFTHAQACRLKRGTVVLQLEIVFAQVAALIGRN